MRYKITKVLTLILSLFVGIGAMGGGICMLIKPDGSIMQMQDMLPYFQVLPFAKYMFQDYLFSGIMLILVNGISNLIASYFMIKNKRIGFVLGTIFGITLMLWITIQFVIFPLFWIDILYFVLGVLQFLIGYTALVSWNQDHFYFNEADYKNLGQNQKILVVYFSRKNYTKKIAYKKADELGAKIEGLTTNERTADFLGFLWCGRFGMHGWGMKTNPLNTDLNSFDRIVIVTPIWVFRMCAPIRNFISENAKVLKTKKIDMIFNHFNPWLPKGAVREVEKYISLESVESKITWLGHTFYPHHEKSLQARFIEQDN